MNYKPINQLPTKLRPHEHEHFEKPRTLTKRLRLSVTAASTVYAVYWKPIIGW